MAGCSPWTANALPSDHTAKEVPLILMHWPPSFPASHQPWSLAWSRTYQDGGLGLTKLGKKSATAPFKKLLDPGCSDQVCSSASEAVRKPVTILKRDDKTFLVSYQFKLTQLPS